MSLSQFSQYHTTYAQRWCIGMALEPCGHPWIAGKRRQHQSRRCRISNVAWWSWCNWTTKPHVLPHETTGKFWQIMDNKRAVRRNEHGDSIKDSETKDVWACLSRKSTRGKAVNHISYMIKKESDEHIQFNLRWKPRQKKKHALSQNRSWNRYLAEFLACLVWKTSSDPLLCSQLLRWFAILHWNWAHQDTRSRFD